MANESLKLRHERILQEKNKILLFAVALILAASVSSFSQDLGVSGIVVTVSMIMLITVGSVFLAKDFYDPRMQEIEEHLAALEEQN